MARRLTPPVTHIPGGRFIMGDDAIAEREAPNPPHEVELSPYAMGVHPVTNAEYRIFVEATRAAAPAAWSDHRFSAPEQPVVTVSWDDAMAYCAWAGGRLPTEAQWEHCARGADGRHFPWGFDEPSPERAHFAQDWNAGATCAIGIHPAGIGPFGNHDLTGNVWEWCLDAFVADAHIERQKAPRDPLVSAKTNVRPLRGGCWRSIDSKLQAAYRNWFHRAARHVTIGFRLCIPKTNLSGET